MSDSLTTRDWQPSDMPRLAQLHFKMNPGYPLPQSFGPLFCVGKAVADETGLVIGFASLKITSEAFLWIDPDTSGYKRARAVIALNKSCADTARNLGLDDCSAWIPPKLQRCFGKILKRLGWQRSPWRNWSVRL